MNDLFIFFALFLVLVSLEIRVYKLSKEIKLLKTFLASFKDSKDDFWKRYELTKPK